MYEDGEEEPPCNFSTYVAEGDKLFNSEEYQKALESYTTALGMRPKDKSCLVARSKCYLQIGNAQKALEDAETSLSEDKEFHKGLYHKAEALYQMGDFEYALVFYHRGHKLRPELQEFRLGIQKAQEAIDNCVGSPSSVKLENKGDLSFFNKMDEGQGKAKPRAGYRQTNKSNQKNARAQNTKSGTSSKTAKALLGELYADREYLERLLKDDDLTKGSSGGMTIYELVSSGINYLDTRTEFWRQQKPMYARKRDRSLLQQKWSNKKQSDSDYDEPTKFVLNNLEDIDQALADGRPTDSLNLATRTLKTVTRMNDSEIPNKPDVIANLHSCIGNAHLELGQTDKALEHHEKDLAIANEHKLTDAESRALDNLGRVYARIGQFKKAIECWMQKIPFSRSSLESTWLYHEIGRCHLELDESEKAKEYGQNSLEEARKAEDDVWQLNASVLIAQAEVKLEEYHSAIESFEQSLEMAKLQGDDAAEKAITRALADIRERIEKKDEESGAENKPAESSSDNANGTSEETT